MPRPIIVPRLGWSMEEGVFTEWLKQEGEFVRAGEMLYVLEGEKSSQEIESFESGILHIPANAPRPGDTVTVGQQIAWLLDTGETPASITSAMVVEKKTESNSSPHPPSPVEPKKVIPTSTETQRIASPRARRTAAKIGVNWQTVQGTGRNGRVRERDVLAAGQMQSLPDTVHLSVPGTLHTPSRIRRSIAQRMFAACQQAAPVTLFTKVDASALFATRQKFKAKFGDSAPGYQDMLIKLIAAALPECPELNACWLNDRIYLHDEIHIALAVDTPQGLVAPVLRNVSKLTLGDIASHSRILIEQASSNQLTEDQLQGGTFTITNLGMYDIDHFTPILNLPQSAILGMGRIREEAIISEGKVVPGRTLSLSLTFDHRILDGAPAARWLQHLGKAMQQADSQLESLEKGRIH